MDSPIKLAHVRTKKPSLRDRLIAVVGQSLSEAEIVEADVLLNNTGQNGAVQTTHGRKRSPKGLMLCRMKALAIKRLADKGATNSEIARALGMARSTLANDNTKKAPLSSIIGAVARKDFQDKFMATVGDRFAGDRSADRLIDIATNGKAIESVFAIKEIHKIMVPRDDVATAAPVIVKVVNYAAPAPVPVVDTNE